MENTTIILGTHNNVSLIRKENGNEMYYSKATGKTAISIRGFARLTGCNPQTISNQAVKLGLGKDLEMFTQQGVQGVKLLMEDELGLLFEAIAKSKIKKETKDKAAQVSAKFVQAGFRLMVLMEVAPEIVAKEAINNITDPAKAREVKLSAEVQEEYLESFHNLQDAGKACGFQAVHHAMLNGHNNKLVGVENGARNKASEIEKKMLKVLQTVEEIKLENNRERYKGNAWFACNSAKKAGTQTAEFLAKTV